MSAYAAVYVTPTESLPKELGLLSSCLQLHV